MIVLGSNSSSGAYQISRSVRLRSSASGYFSRTFGTPTNNKIWTWSAWVKVGKLGVMNTLFSAGSSGTVNTYFAIYNDQLFGQHSTVSFWTSTAVFRDPSAWYHIVIAMDTTQSTAAYRTRIYVNGVE